MSNKNMTAVEWLVEQFEKYYVFRDLKNTIVYQQAKEMEKEQMIDAINNVSENNVKYANMIVSSWSQIEGELFMHNTKLAETYYNETFGEGRWSVGNSEQPL
jgi:hypothetical protein